MKIFENKFVISILAFLFLSPLSLAAAEDTAVGDQASAVVADTGPVSAPEGKTGAVAESPLSTEPAAKEAVQAVAPEIGSPAASTAGIPAAPAEAAASGSGSAVADKVDPDVALADPAPAAAPSAGASNGQAKQIQNVPLIAGGKVQYVTLSKPGKEVFVKNRAGEWIPGEDGMVILPGDQVRTSKDSTVMIILDGGKVGNIEVKEGSLFTLLRADIDPATGDKKTLLNLAVGKMMVKAETLTGNSSFEVQTPSAITGVRGTLFEVEVEGKLPPLR
jgi:hypothetical protein